MLRVAQVVFLYVGTLLMGAAMDELLLFGHLLGVGLLVLGTGMFLIGTEGLRRARTVGEAQGSAALSQLATRVLATGGPLLLGFGFALAARRWSFSQPWIVASLALVALLGVNGLRSERWLARVHAALPNADVVPPAAHAPWHHGANRATLAALAELEFLMTVKPTGSALLVSLLVAAALATGLSVTTPFPRGRTEDRPTRTPEDRARDRDPPEG